MIPTIVTPDGPHAMTVALIDAGIAVVGVITSIYLMFRRK